MAMNRPPPDLGNGLKEVTIQNSSYGDLNEIKVYLDNTLFEEMSNSKRKGGSELNLFKSGRATRGFKHLLSYLREKDSHRVIIFSKESTSKTETSWLINFDIYQKYASSNFYSRYREIGLNAAYSFLSQNFPEDFPKGSTITGKQLRSISNNPKPILVELEKRKTSKNAILESSLNILNSLKQERKNLRSQINELKRFKSTSNYLLIKEGINQLEDRLNRGSVYPETKGPNSWQSWIYNNNWIFGPNYLKPIEKAKIGLDNIPDFVFPTIDGFVDILEIKLPQKEVIREDKSHKNSFFWSQDASEAIGQVVTYLSEIERNRPQVTERILRENNIELDIIKPRALLLISSENGWGESKKEAFRKLSFSLHGIEILTYSDLKRRANGILKMYYED